MSASPNRVRELRETLGLSKQALAARADITVRGLQLIENGHNTPRLDTAWALVEGLGADRFEVVFPGRKVTA